MPDTPAIGSSAPSAMGPTLTPCSIRLGNEALGLAGLDADADDTARGDFVLRPPAAPGNRGQDGDLLGGIAPVTSKVGSGSA